MTDKVNELVKRLAEDLHNDDTMRNLTNFMDSHIRYHIKPIIHDVQTQEDIMQDTYLVVWRNVQKLDHYDGCYTWIIKIAKHRAIDVAKKENRVQTVSFDSSYTMHMLDHFACKSGSSLDKRICLQEFFKKLPYVDRCVALLIGANYTQKEVAAITKLTVRQVRYKINKLREEISREFNTGS